MPDSNFTITDSKKRKSLLTDEELKAAGIDLSEAPDIKPSITGDITVNPVQTPVTSDSIPTSSLGSNVKVPPDVTPNAAQLQTLQSLSPPEAVVNPNYQAPSILPTQAPSPTTNQSYVDKNFISLEDKQTQAQQAILDKAKSEGPPDVPLPGWLGPLSNLSWGFDKAILNNLNPITLGKGIFDLTQPSPATTFNIGNRQLALDPMTSIPVNLAANIMNEGRSVENEARQATDPAEKFWKAAYSGVPIPGVPTMLSKMYDAIKNKDWEGLGTQLGNAGSQVATPEVYKYVLTEGGPQALGKVFAWKNKARVAQIKGYDAAKQNYIDPSPDPDLMWEQQANLIRSQTPEYLKNASRTGKSNLLSYPNTERLLMKKLVNDHMDYNAQKLDTGKILQEIQEHPEYYQQAFRPQTLQGFKDFLTKLGKDQRRAFNDYGQSYWFRRVLTQLPLEAAGLAMFHSPLGAAGMAGATYGYNRYLRAMEDPNNVRTMIKMGQNPQSIPFLMNASPAIRNLFRGAAATNLLNSQNNQENQ